MSRQLLEQLVPQHWESGKVQLGSGTNRVRWLQGLADLVNRPVSSRAIATTSAAHIILAAAIHSLGVGTSPLQPKRYQEFTVKARVSFSVSTAASAYLYVVRTSAATPGGIVIPIAGAGLNPGDVVVGGDAFTGGAFPAVIKQIGTLSVLDTGLDKNTQYAYYFAASGTPGAVLTMSNNSQLQVMERS